MEDEELETNLMLEQGSDQQDAMQHDRELEAQEQPRSRPVVSTMVAGGAIGWLAGSMLGVGSVVSSTAGAVLGASLASRQDDTGERIREVSTQATKRLSSQISHIHDTLAEKQFVQEASTKAASLVKALEEANEKYRILERVELGANEASRAAQQAVQVMKPRVAQAVEQADRYGYVPRIQQALERMDDRAGFSKTVQVVRSELRS